MLVLGCRFASAKTDLVGESNRWKLEKHEKHEPNIPYNDHKEGFPEPLNSTSYMQEQSIDSNTSVL